MNKLRQFYVTSMTGFTVVLVLLALAYALWLEPKVEAKFGPDSLVTTFAQFVTSRPAILLIVLAADWLVRTKLWRRFHPELDFNGEWTGDTIYAQAHVGQADLPKTVPQKVTIEQDCLRLRLLPSRGKDFVFRSRTIDIEEDGAMLVYAYIVNYSATSNERPPETHGFEELSVILRDAKKRPKKLQGWFAHCARGQSPVLSGNVRLERA